MSKKFLIVVDMQNDFVSGVLGSDNARAIVPKIKEKLLRSDSTIVFTRDTHQKNYLDTQEGINLPIEHCIIGTNGWQICEELKSFVKGDICDKVTFGSYDLPYLLLSLAKDEDIDEIELCGLCTDICVISNAMVLKAAFPETLITIDASCCAGTTKEAHEIALNAMKAVQIKIKDGDDKNDLLV